VVAVGLLLFAGALGSAATLFMQNRAASAVHVHVLGHSLTLQPYSIMVAGAVIALVGLVGIAVMRRGAGRARRLRRQRDALQSSFFFETFGDDQAGGAEESPAGPWAR
jgi:hypothetical protein